jgi:hypothetical protein
MRVRISGRLTAVETDRFVRVGLTVAALVLAIAALVTAVAFVRSDDAGESPADRRQRSENLATCLERARVSATQGSRYGGLPLVNSAKLHDAQVVCRAQFG